MNQLIEEIKILNKTFYGVQKLRQQVNNRIGAMERREITPTEKILEVKRHVEESEKHFDKMLKTVVAFHPLWITFFQFIKGIDTRLASCLISGIGDIGKFDTVSKLWSYCGLGVGYVECKCNAKEPHQIIMSNYKEGMKCQVLKDGNGKRCGADVILIKTVQDKAPKRKIGWHFLFNTQLKTDAIKCVDQFIKARTPHYRDLYDTCKEREKREHPEMKPIYIERRTKRFVAKRLLAYIYEAWRTVEDLPDNHVWIAKINSNRKGVRKNDM